MRHGARTAALLILAATAVSCSSMTAGTVTGKGYDPSYSYTTITTIGGCPCYPMVNEVAECWRLDLREGDDTGSVCVAPADWENVQIGQRWTA